MGCVHYDTTVVVVYCVDLAVSRCVRVLYVTLSHYMSYDTQPITAVHLYVVRPPTRSSPCTLL